MDLDQMLEDGGYRFCRFSDDLILFCRKKEEAEKTYAMLRARLGDLGLGINKTKSGIFYGPDQQYLGYRFVYDKETKHLAAVRKKKQENTHFRSWNRSCIERVDRSYHIVNDGILTRKDYNILFENKDGRKYLPVETTQALNIHANVIFSGEFFRFLNQKRINVQLFDKYGNSVGYFLTSNNGYRTKTMLKQAEIYLDSSKRLAVAKAMEIAALHNIRTNLKYYSKKRGSDSFAAAIAEISSEITLVNQAKTIEEMLIIEARARQTYYQMFNMICDSDDFRFTKRTRRPPQDAVNALISFGNTYLYSRLATEIGKTSLDIRIGFVHAATNRNQTLNLDLADIFKPVIVDRAIFTVINKGMIQRGLHFESVKENGKDGIYLNKTGKSLFLQELDKKIYQKQTVKNQSKSYDTILREEVRKVLRMVLYGEPYKPYKYY